MNKVNSTRNKSIAWTITEWLFVLVFFALGILNLVFVHPVPGIFYLILAVFYLPSTEAYLRKNLGFGIPVLLKIIMAFVVLWATLAVGDLAEMYGF